jgi:WD40 repeat protein
MKYQGFISYSHAADGKLAPALQQALHNLAKPWYSFRLIHVFRDQTSLSANPALWASIETALTDSEYFLLMASPEAARSKWVQQEVRWWLANRPIDKLLIVLTDGDAQWDETANDFDWTRTTALPKDLHGRFKEEPLYIDLRWAKNQDHLSLRHSQFRAAVLDLAAPLHGKPKDELDGEDVRLYRSAQRLKRIAIGTLATLLIMVAVAGLWARLEQDVATSRERAVTALSQLKNDPILSVGIATEAVNAWQTPEAVSALRQALQESSYESATLPHNDKAPVVSAQYSADGTRLLTAGLHGEIDLWDPATPLHPVASFTHRGTLSAAVLSRDARYILTAAGDKEGVENDGAYKQQEKSTVHVWDTTRRTDEPVASLKQRGNVYAAALSPDGRIAVAAGIDCTARLWAWNEKDREPIVLQGDSCRPHETVNDTQAAVQNVESDCHPSWDPHWGGWGSRQGVFATAFSPDGQLVATGGGDCLVRVWDVATGQLRSILAGHTAEVTRLVFSPDGTYLVSASGLPGGGFDSVPRIWDVGTWQGHPLLGWKSNDRVYGVAVSSDSQFVATTSGDDVVRVWNAKTHEPWAKLLGHSHWVGSAAFSPVDNRLLVTTGGEDGTARVWDIGANPDQNRELFVLHGHTDAVGNAVFSPERGQLVTTSLDGKARLWDLNLGAPLERLPDEVAMVRDDASMSPDKRFTLSTAHHENLCKLA